MKHFLLSAVLIASSALAMAQDGEAQDPNKKTFYPDRSEACNPDQIFSMTEVNANYKGGPKQLQSELNDALSLHKSVNGTFYVMVFINCEDRAYKFQKLRGFDTESDARIIAELEALQNWTTGSQNGEKVDFSIGLPILFKKGKVSNIEIPVLKLE